MKVSNPLTIIAIFAGSAEAFATGALIALPPEMQSIFIYFVMLFPALIVIAFFLILLNKPQSLYAPSDFENQEHYLEINSIRKAITEEAEKAITEATANGQIIDPKSVSLQLAESTIHAIESNLNKLILSYLEKHPTEAFTAKSLGHIFNTNRNLVTLSLHHLECSGFIQKGKDGNVIVWQAKPQTH